MKIVMTGGHHSSALPVIALLREKYPEIKIHWLGHKASLKGNTNTSLEYRDIQSLDIPFYNLKAGKLYKTYDPVRLLKIPLGFLHAFYLLLKIRPKLVVSFGGYLAAPTVVAAWFLRIPSVTHEQTVVAGYANRVIAKFAKKIMVSWPQSQSYFPKEKTVFTGLPLRDEIFSNNETLFRIDNELPTVFIMGGKTGAHVINDAVREALPDLLSFCNVIHQCGNYSLFKDYEKLLESYKNFESEAKGHYFLQKFIYTEEIGSAFSRSALFVGRAGAHTAYELLSLKKPALLIPIPWVSHNEQLKNANVVETSGLGKVLEQKDLSAKRLLSEIHTMLENSDQYKLNTRGSNLMQKVDSARAILETIEPYLK